MGKRLEKTFHQRSWTPLAAREVNILTSYSHYEILHIPIRKTVIKTIKTRKKCSKDVENKEPSSLARRNVRKTVQ